MKRRSVFLAALLGIVLAAGCREYIVRSAVNAIATQIRPADSPLVRKLAYAGNPKGEGIVVYVKPQASCAPEYIWIWINNSAGSYAIDQLTRS
jgi:hypothetical protein